jgi:hypothetical protein
MTNNLSRIAFPLRLCASAVRIAFNNKRVLLLALTLGVVAGVGFVNAAMSQPPVTSSRAANSAPAPKPAEKKPYQIMGAPVDPKVDVRWNVYHDHAAATKILQALEKAYPKRAKLQSLGKSYGGRDMWVLTIGNFEKGSELEKPAFWIDGGIHANEIQATEVALYTAWYLLESYGRNAMITRLVDERVFYIMPMMSPDSRDAHMYEPNSTHSPRSGQRPVDDDRDGLVDEDKPDDLDGDGSITEMRVRDPNGRWKPHPDFPELMIRVKPDEKGEYTLLGSEGFDNDGDGKVNEDSDGSYDPNRNWPWNWQPDYVQPGAHRYPFSIAEDRMVGEFIMSKPNIAGAQSYHNAGGMILRGPGAKDDKYDGADIAVYKLIAEKGERMLPGYKSMNIADELYEVYGGEVDWLHAMNGAYMFTNELFTPFNYFRKETGEGYFGPAEQQYEFAKLLLLGDGIVKWHEVDHPQYGKVEVGGLRKEWVRQPPSFLLEEELHRNMAFTMYHADQMPQVRVQSVKVKALGGGVNEVTAAIVNERLTPTHNSADVRNHISPPDRISITGGAGMKVLLATTADNILHGGAKEQKRNPAQVRVKNIGGMGVVYVRWLVTGGGPYTVAVRSTKGGVHTATSAP